MFTSPLKRFLLDESGQGVTEYGAVLAFVAAFIALAFAFGAPFRTQLIDAFHSVADQVNALNAAVS